MTTTLIGLGGALRAGKDAVADHLVAKHGFVKLGMSDALNDAMLALNPIIPHTMPDQRFGHFRYRELYNLMGYVEVKKNPEVRALLQRLGTEVGRDMIGPNTWTDIAARKVNRHLEEGRDVVITGIRFLEELAMVRSFAGRAVWVHRPNVLTPSSHASENSISESLFDLTINNVGNLDDLHNLTDILVERTHAR